MIYIILGTIYGLFLFLCSISSYVLGLKHGKQLSEKIIPTLNNPIKEVIQHFEAKKEENEIKSVIGEYWGE